MLGKTVTIRLNESELKEYKSLAEKLNVSIGRAIKWGSAQFHFNQKSDDINNLQLTNQLQSTRVSYLEESLGAIFDVINDRFVFDEGEWVAGTPIDATEEFAMLWNSADIGFNIKIEKPETNS